MKTLVKLLTFWIPVKKWRKSARNMCVFLLETRPILKKLNKIYPDAVFLLSPHAGIGEFVQSLCLMKALKNKINKQIVVVTNKKTEASVCKLYNQTVTCHYDPDIKLQITDKMEKNIRPAKIYSFYQQPLPDAAKRHYDIDFLKDYFSLDQTSNVEKIVPNRPEIINDDFLNLEKILKNEKTVLIFPDANTYDSSVITKNLWIELAQKLQNKGYTCIFNSKDNFDGFLNVFLPIDETCYLSSLASAIITFRSGLAELLALTTSCKMLVVYPNGTTNLFRKECNFSIEAFIEKLKKSPFYLDDPNNPVVSSFKVGAISENFERNNCKNFFYDFNNLDFINFFLYEL